MDFPPTPEQAAAIETFAGGMTFALEAGAGTGKTSTLQFLAESAPRRRGVYVAFNAAIATEARKKFPRNITVKTSHALALAGTGHAFQRRLNGPRIPLGLVASRLGVTAPFHPKSDRRVSTNAQASLAMKTVQRFCATSHGEIVARHVPRMPGLDDEQQSVLANHIVPLARRIWEDVSDPDGHRFRFDHDHYLKVWALQRPRWGFDFVLFDEAQDTNQVVAAMVEQQVGYGSQLVAVGDSAQAIYGWRGATDAMATFNVQRRLRLTQSFRFGPAIADEANKWLLALGTDMRLSGNPARRSRIVTDMAATDAILCRTNAVAIGELFKALEIGTSVGIVGGGSDLKGVATACETLKAGRKTEHPEFSLFDTWDDLVEYAESGADASLERLVKIVEDHGPQAIRRAIDAADNEESAQLVISTAHKAKGREWPRVRLADDFAEPRPTPESSGEPVMPVRDELMLSYVAVTRAMKDLDRGALKWIDSPPRPRPPTATAARRAGNAQLASAGPVSTTEPKAVPRERPVANYVLDARRTTPSAYARWTHDSDEALLAGYRAGATLDALMAIFGRTAGAITGRVLKLHGLTWGKDAAFDADGKPCIEAPGVRAPEPETGDTEPYVVDPAWSEPVEYYEPDLDEPDEYADDYAEWREEQDSIHATFEYLMERDDI